MRWLGHVGKAPGMRAEGGNRSPGPSGSELTPAWKAQSKRGREGRGKEAEPLLESVVGFTKRARDRECPHLSRQLHVTTLVEKGEKDGTWGNWGGTPGLSP